MFGQCLPRLNYLESRWVAICRNDNPWSAARTGVMEMYKGLCGCVVLCTAAGKGVVGVVCICLCVGVGGVYLL